MDVVFIRQACSWDAILGITTDAANVVLCQLCPSTPLSALDALWVLLHESSVAIRVSLLRHGISSVIGVRAEKQVSRICAFRIVAFVENLHRGRNWTDVHLIRNAMRIFKTTTIVDFPIPKWMAGTSPFPAGIGII